MPATEPDIATAIFPPLRSFETACHGFTTSTTDR